MFQVNALESYMTHEGVQLAQRRTTSDVRVLKGIEIDVFSHKINNDHFENVIQETCGSHFSFSKIRVAKDANTFYIRPLDHCLVEGGMMYTSAISIISSLSVKGLLVKGFRTDERKRA